VFAVYYAERKEGFLCEVKNRERETLFPLIKNFMRPGTIIYFYRARVYDTIEDEGYSHIILNHGRNYMDPRTSATTNHVEYIWQKAKNKYKIRFRMHPSTFMVIIVNLCFFKV
ncbi:hypothetical protein H311_01787, partial [Anncaliia algerae PRA109]